MVTQTPNFLSLTVLALFPFLSMGVAGQQKKGAAPTSYISIERSICYGTCPSYKLAIFSDGRVVYEGFEYVKTKGRVEQTTKRSEFRRILSDLTNAGYFGFRKSYAEVADGCGSVGSDAPTVTIKVKIGKRTKTTSHYFGCAPGSREFEAELEKLLSIEKLLDRSLSVERWIGSAEERKIFTFPTKLPNKTVPPPVSNVQPSPKPNDKIPTMSVRYNVIKDPKVGDGPSRLVGRYATREEAERVAAAEAAREENRGYNIVIQVDDSPVE